MAEKVVMEKEKVKTEAKPSSVKPTTSVSVSKEKLKEETAKVKEMKAEKELVEGAAKKVEKVKPEKEAVKKAKKAKETRVKPVKVKGSSEVIKRKKMKEKNIKLPVFRGRFGQRMLRKVHKAKWNKWRKPRGIDIYFNKEDGAVPKTGYKRRKEIRGLHPSGFQEVLVFSVKDLENVDKDFQAVRLASTIGKKKREHIIVKANDLKIKVLNG